MFREYLKKSNFDKSNETSQAELISGYELLEAGKFDLAEVHFKNLISKNSRSLDALRALVKISTARRDRVATLKYLERILEMKPDALYERAFHAFRQEWQDFDKTRATLEELVAIAKEQGLNADEADVVIQTIQYFATARQRIDYLSEIKSLLQITIQKNPAVCLPEKITVAELSLILEDYEDLEALVAELKKTPNKQGLQWRLGPLFFAAKKIASPNYPDFNAEKVFAIGLSRTGTTSLNSALKILGYQSVHWWNPITRDLLHQEDFLLFDAFTDISISHQFEWLYHTYPNSKFILTMRPIESWAKSVNDHYVSQHDTNGPKQLNNPSAKKRYRNRAGQLEANLYAQHDNWSDAYTYFTKRVYSFFEDKPKDRFLEMSITEGEGWENLCPFLGKPTPEVNFPNQNPNLRRK